MKSVTKAALATLSSPDFFTQLRGALARSGLRGEEKFGVGVFFALVSRFLPNPLRLAIHETTEGSARYVVQRVASFLQPRTVCGVSSDQGWSRFVKDPMHSVAYVKQWWNSSPKEIRFEVSENRLSRISRTERDGRTIETPETVEAPFACVAEAYPWDGPDRLRWLTIKLPKPPVSVPNGLNPLEEDEISKWIEVQHLLRLRAQRPILLPEWSDVVIAQACRDERAARHIPAFLHAWKTMSLLGSFCADEERPAAELIQASFEDLAKTSLLLRGLFQEGRLFPSPNKVLNEAFSVGTEFGVTNPLSGKGIRYTKYAPQTPAQYVGLF